MRTKVINLFGGSGTGKSTVAALVYGAMKVSGMDVELVREHVKKWAIAGRIPQPLDQITLLSRQLDEELPLYGKVQYLVTDSPLMLKPFYQQYHYGQTYLLEAVQTILDETKPSAERYNFFLTRTKVFDPRHRYETAQQAAAIDVAMAEYLRRNGTYFHKIAGADDRSKAEIIHDFFLNERSTW